MFVVVDGFIVVPHVIMTNIKNSQGCKVVSDVKPYQYKITVLFSKFWREDAEINCISKYISRHSLLLQFSNLNIFNLNISIRQITPYI